MKLRSLCMVHATGPEAAGPVAPPQSPVAHQMRSHPPPPVYISCMLSTRGRWDEDGGGSLDLSELKHALSKTMKEAKEFNSKPDPAQQQIQRLQKRARMADEAADSVEKADSLERELEEFSKQLESRADVRLGALLQKRNIKPGEFVVRFSKSQGASAGELSKADFRKAVLLLFEGKQGGGGGSASQASSPRKEGEVSTSPSEINAVFDQYDDDGGGSMDVDEAKTMIKGLQAAGRRGAGEAGQGEGGQGAAREGHQEGRPGHGPSGGGWLVQLTASLPNREEHQREPVLDKSNGGLIRRDVHLLDLVDHIWTIMDHTVLTARFRVGHTQGQLRADAMGSHQ